MNKYVRLYNQNRGLIIGIIIVIALIIIIIQTLNSIIKVQREAKINNIIEENSSNNTTSNTISQSNVSSITGETVRNSEANEKTIKQFVEYCNEGEINKAYDMLTNECKMLVYPSLEHFKTGYIDRIFYINRMYTLENWYTSGEFNTYYIKYIEDILASGNAISNRNVSDYITVVRGENQNKINISNYVGTKEINRKSTQNGVTITADKIHYYMDYTVLDIKVKNSFNNTICLDTKEKTGATYVYDQNKVKYMALLNEISAEELQVLKSMERSITLKFNKIYNPGSRTLIRT